MQVSSNQGGGAEIATVLGPRGSYEASRMPSRESSSAQLPFVRDATPDKHSEVRAPTMTNRAM